MVPLPRGPALGLLLVLVLFFILPEVCGGNRSWETDTTMNVAKHFGAPVCTAAIPDILPTFTNMGC